MAQRVRVHIFRKRGPPGGSFASMVDHLRSDGEIAGMTMPAREQPYAGLSPQAAPVSLEFVEQFWAEQHIAVFAAFTTLDVDDHALTVDVAHKHGRVRPAIDRRRKYTADETFFVKITVSRELQCWELNELLGD